MEVKEIPVSSVEVSEFNVRKDLADGEHDSTIDDLAKSIAKQGLVSPITVFRKPNGRYGLIAGQRRLLAFRHLGLSGSSLILGYFLIREREARLGISWLNGPIGN